MPVCRIIYQDQALTMLAIIIPVLNEEDAITACLEALADACTSGASIVVADGGSSDRTILAAQPLCDTVISAPRGRASQMNAGAAASTGDIILFLHADTRLPPEWQSAIVEGLASGKHDWGRFDVTIEGRHMLFPVIAFLINLRSRWTGIATGDQAVFVRRNVFEELGGYPDIPLMEDIALSRALKQRGAPLCLQDKVTTSGRRWEKHGVVRTILAMWRLRTAYYFGASPAQLARQYGYRPRKDHV